MIIHETIEPVRGCGKRKPGGLYLVAGNHFSSCCALPLPLTVCPCCGQGIKFFRGFGWINPHELFAGVECTADGTDNSTIGCIVNRLPGRMGLMWVGEQFYTTTEFSNEAALYGISKRIAAIPIEFEIGKTWLALAHKKAVAVAVETLPAAVSLTYSPGIFMFFRPSRIEYVVRGDETTEHLERLEKRGVTLVRVIGHIGEQQTLNI
jgi:hypothetical protein